MIQLKKPTADMIKIFGKPIVSTSANFSGEASPASFYEIDEELKDAIDYIVDWNQDAAPVTRASSIIRLGKNGEIQVLRK